MGDSTSTRAARRLAAIVAADVAGYSRLMGLDEAGTARALREHRAAIDPIVARFGGRIVKTTGDGVLLEFPSVVAAVECAVAVQNLMVERNEQVSEDLRMLFRLGVNLGDVLVQGDDILGDGVNVAARLEGIAEPGGICVSDNVYQQVRGKVEVSFDDLGEQQLKNIARPVHAYRARLGGTVAGKPVAVLPLPDKPSIAVLPFQNMSGDPEQEYFADGVTDEILTALSRFRELFVIARTSSFTYKGKAVDVRQIGRELGVRYVLEGSVRKAGGRVRITGQLIDATSGVQVWSDRFEGEHDDIFDLQDRAASAVVSAVAPKLEQAEIARAVAKATDSLDAYDCFMRASACIYRWDRKDLEEAELLLDRSIKLDPRFASAYAYATWCIAWRLVNSWSDDPTQDAGRCGELARKAVDLAPDDSNVLCLAGYSLAQVVGALEEGIALINRAVSLNPNLARAWALSAVVNIYLGNPEIAIQHNERAMRLSPKDTILHLMMHTTARGYFYAGRLDEAIVWSTKAMRQSPHFHDQSWLNLIASYALTQRREEATAALAKYLAIHPQARIGNLWQLAGFRFPDKNVARLAEGLRLAGMPE
jgi:TolB-like protein/class 3 adenylate cyclase